MVKFMFTSIFSHQERERGRGGGKKEMAGSLAICVQRHLRVEVALTLTADPQGWQEI